MSLECTEVWEHVEKFIVILGAREDRRNLGHKVPSKAKISSDKVEVIWPWLEEH